MTKSHYAFAPAFRELYAHAVELYRDGKRGAENYFNEVQLGWLAANGIAAQHIYDYAEDDVCGGEPGYDNALAIEIVRRDYFLTEQKGQPSDTVLDQSAMPAKHDAVEGITWLPRLLPKTRAKLRGELPPSLMYCCGGDRNFFRTHDILPAEFIAVVWRHFHDDQAIIAWTRQRIGKSA